MNFQQQAVPPWYQVPRKLLFVPSLRFLICEEREVGGGLFFFFFFLSFNMLGFRLFQRMIIFKMLNQDTEW